VHFGARFARRFNFARSFARASDFCYGGRADGANLICLNFTGERDFSGVKHRLDLRGFKFKGEKFHKAAGQGKI
jgi:hypothetical protein